jgi:hypothetical protein
MKKLGPLFCLTLMLASLPPVFSQDRGGGVRLRVRDERGARQAEETAVYSDSYALVIGNSAYDDPACADLPEASADVAAVKDVLEKQHGFKVEVALNQRRDALLRLIDQFISRYGQRYNSRLLIYYSGHGYTALLPDERRMGYLVMPDAPSMPSEERALKTPPTYEEFERFLPSAITMDEIETYARRITARHALFVFDSCFSGTALYKDLTAGVPEQITTEELKPVRAYLTAGNETQRVPAFSKFRRKFVAALMGDADTNGDGYILASELGRWVSIEVEKETGRRQTPMFGKSDVFKRGDVIFVSPRGPAPIAAATPPPGAATQRSAEQLFWQEIEKRNSVAGYKTYLSAYPKGEYAGVAELRVENLLWEDFKPLALNLLKYPFVLSFSDDLALTSAKDGKCVWIDRAVREVVTGKYNGCSQFSEGLAEVSLGSKAGFIDKSGREVIALVYEDVESFSQGFAQVRLNGKSFYIDKSGQKSVPPPPGTQPPTKPVGDTSPFFLVMANGKFGFKDQAGRQITPVKYDAIWCWAFMNDGFAGVLLGGRKGFVDVYGNEHFDVR